MSPHGQHDHLVSAVGSQDPLSGLVQSSALRSGGVYLWEQVSSESLRFPGSVQTAIHVVLEGRAFVHLAGEGSVPIDKGQVFWLPKDLPHIVSPSPGAGEPVCSVYPMQQRSMTSSAEPSYIVRYAPAPRAPTATVLSLPFLGLVSEQALLFEGWPNHMTLDGDDATPQSVARAIAMLVRAPRPGYQLVCSRLAEGLLVLVLAQAATRFSGLAEALRPPVDPRLQRAMRAVREDLARPWTLQSIAREAGMSRTLFARRFRDALGGTVADYLRAQRIQRAQELLGRNAASVETVCAEVGFSSVSSFSRSFLKIVGVRPGEFARRHAPPTSGAPLSSIVRDTSPPAFAERGWGRRRLRPIAG